VEIDSAQKEAEILFHVTHTHTHETCPAGIQDRMDDFNGFLESLKSSTNVKVHGAFVVPLQHIFYFILEADDFGEVSRLLGPIMTLGSGEVTPVLTFDVAAPMAESGAFRMS
jgi:hypothetical protein